MNSLDSQFADRLCSSSPDHVQDFGKCQYFDKEVRGMSLPLTDADKPEGQATFEMANLRRQRTKLPFVVWVSQRDNLQHDIRVKVAQSAKVIPSQLGSYSVRPFAHVGGPQLNSNDEKLLEAWIAKNIDTLVDFWNADIEYTEDMIEKIIPV